MTNAYEEALKAVRNMRRPEPKWTPEHEFRLILLWADGQTCNQISEAFKESGFRVSRNAVAAKVKRMRAAGVPLAERESPIFRKVK